MSANMERRFQPRFSLEQAREMVTAPTASRPPQRGRSGRLTQRSAGHPDLSVPSRRTMTPQHTTTSSLTRPGPSRTSATPQSPAHTATWSSSSTPGSLSSSAEDDSNSVSEWEFPQVGGVKPGLTRQNQHVPISVSVGRLSNSHPGLIHRNAAIALNTHFRSSGLQHMEELMGSAKVTTNGKVMHVLSPELWDIDILDNGRTISDFIDTKIKELGSVDNEEPFYVANLDSMFQRHLRWLTNLPRVKPFYAVKCNNTAAVLRMMSSLGTGFDCASKREIQMVLSHGVTPDKIIYAHTTKPLSHIRYACAHGINTMTFDSEDELLKISLCHPKAKLVLRIAADDSKSLVRLSSKFGARLVSADKLLERAAELGLDVIGVSFHVGSGCTGGWAFKQAIADARLVFDTGNLLGFQMRLLDIGGGFSGIGDFQEKFEEFSEVINEALDEFFPPDCGVQIIAEPGRFYVESAFTVAANVIAKREIFDDLDEHSDGEENRADRMMMYYLNDGVYGSLSCIVFDPAHSTLEPYPHKAVESSERRYQSVIWGPTCDCIDKVTENYWLPELHVGDWLLIDNMGAYSVSVSTDFNSFERAHIYPVVTAETWHTLNLSHTYDID